jgi:hypothetical protein
MDERQDWDEKTRRGRGLGRGVLVSYLSTGAALAVTRVALLVWVNHPHTMTETEWYLAWGVYPEALVAVYTPLGVMGLSRMEFFLIFGSILALGSFVLSTPILLVGWLMRRRRSNVGT